MRNLRQLSSSPLLLAAIAPLVGIPHMSALVPLQWNHDKRRTISKSSSLNPCIPVKGLRRNGSRAYATSDATSTNPDNNRKEELTPERVAELIEVSFVNGVMQLAQGYVDVIKLFIASVLAAYKMGLTSTQLLETVAACPHQSANRPLMKEEEQLRSTWIQMVYLVLDHVGYNGTQPMEEGIVSSQVQEKYAAVIPILEEMKGEKLQATLIFEKLGMDPSQIPLEGALFLQTLKVGSLTFVVLEEEAQCIADKTPLKPRPPIPGAFD
jgi:hypothetical protein